MGFPDVRRLDNGQIHLQSTETNTGWILDAAATWDDVDDLLPSIGEDDDVEAMRHLRPFIESLPPPFQLTLAELADAPDNDQARRRLERGIIHHSHAEDVP